MSNVEGGASQEALHGAYIRSVGKTGPGTFSNRKRKGESQGISESVRLRENHPWWKRNFRETATYRERSWVDESEEKTNIQRAILGG